MSKGGTLPAVQPTPPEAPRSGRPPSPFTARRIRLRIPARHALRVVVAAVVAGGVLYRLWLTVGPLGRSPDSDEAIVGLMALRLLRHHELHAFYWNQTYGGSIESVIVAPFVALFGSTTLGLRLGSVLLALLAPVLTWRIARHLFSRGVAVWAGLLALWWPLALVYFGTQERGFYPLTAALGLAAVLMAVNVDESPGLVRHWLGLGLAVGVGWWASPNIVYYALPITLYLVLRGHWRQGRNLGLAALMFVLGSAVWTAANLRSGFASLRTPDWAANSTFWSRLGFFWQKGLPLALGLRRSWDAHWYWGASAGRVLYVAALVAIVLAVRKVLPRLPIDVLLIGVAPFVFAYFPPTWRLSEGRYLYFVASMLPLVVCRVMRYRPGAVLVCAIVGLAALGFVRDYRRLEPPIPAEVQPMIQAIEREGYQTAIANYWIAFRMTYESSEHVIATPLPGQPGVRYLPYVSIVERSRPAYVFNARGAYSSDKALIRALEQAHISYRIVRVRGYYAVLPSRRFVAAV